MGDGATLDEVRQLLDQGSVAEAKVLAQTRNAPSLTDAALHLAWAEVLEDLGLVEEVALELNLAIRDDPGRREAYERLAELHLDQGQPLKAAHVWGSLVKRRPQDPLPYRELGRVLEEAREYAKAQEVYELALARTGEAEFQTLLNNLAFLKEPGEPPAAAPAADQLLPQPHHLVVFISLFAGREGVYARQWVSPTGETGYTPVHEPLTPRVAENHILGNFTVGVYPVRLDNTVNFIAFDLDVAKFALRRAITSQREWQRVMGRVHQTACRLLDAAAAHELPLYLEDSGFKGRHAWIFLDTPVPAGVAKKCGDLLAGQLTPIPPEVTVEVFPKQATVRPGSLGNLIKLPLGIHRKTGKRALLVKPDGQPHPDQLSLLTQVQKAPRRLVYAAIQRLQAGKERPLLPGETPGPEVPPPPPVTEVMAPSPQAPYDLDREPQFQQLMLKCPVLRTLVERVNHTSQLTKEETLVLIHTLGHLEQGPAAVNELFQRCLNAEPSLFLKSRLRGHPMSCPKIRARIPQITAALACNCTFDLASNLYPTPVLHVQALGAAASPLGLTVDSLQFQNLLQDYLKLRRQMKETQLLLGRYETRLAQFFVEAGVEQVQTPLGTLLCRKKEDGEVSFTLEM